MMIITPLLTCNQSTGRELTSTMRGCRWSRGRAPAEGNSMIRIFDWNVSFKNFCIPVDDFKYIPIPNSHKSARSPHRVKEIEIHTYTRKLFEAIDSIEGNFHEYVPFFFGQFSQNVEVQRNVKMMNKKTKRVYGNLAIKRQASFNKARPTLYNIIYWSKVHWRCGI